MEFSGNTGPYLLYTKVRAAAILRKTKLKEFKKVDFSLLDSPEEKELIKILSGFAFSLAQSADEYKPSILAKYLFQKIGLYFLYT